MQVLRGSRSKPEADRSLTRDLADRVGRTDEPGVRVWYPPRQVAFGRRDVAAEGYPRARQAAADHGYEPVTRETGGRAVAFTGDVLAVVRAEPADPTDHGVDDRYERLLADLESALEHLGVEAERGEPPDAFCPGTRSLSAGGGKLAGMAQRVRAEVAVVGGAIVVRDAEAVAGVLTPVYEALGVPFEPSSVGSLEKAGTGADRREVRQTIENSLVGDADATVRRL